MTTTLNKSAPSACLHALPDGVSQNILARALFLQDAMAEKLNVEAQRQQWKANNRLYLTKSGVSSGSWQK